MRQQSNAEAAAFRTAAAGMRKTADAMVALPAVLTRLAVAEDAGDARALLAGLDALPEAADHAGREMAIRLLPHQVNAIRHATGLRM
jgi:hypothetical protein